MRRLIFAIVPTALMVAGCASMRPGQPVDRTLRLNPASLAANPAQADGREVEVTGLLVWEAEVKALHQSEGTYCRASEDSAIRVDWDRWPGVTRADNRRQVTVRGTFRNLPPALPPAGNPAAATAPGPGPLEPGAVVRWLSAPKGECSNRIGQ